MDSGRHIQEYGPSLPTLGFIFSTLPPLFQEMLMPYIPEHQRRSILSEVELRQAPASESAEASTSRSNVFPQAGAAEEGEEGEGASPEEEAPASPGDSSIATVDILLAGSRRAGVAEGREEEEEEEEASDGDSSIATIDYFRWIPEHREDPDAALTPEGSEEGSNVLFDEWLEEEEEEEAPASPGDSSIATMDIMLAGSRRAGVAEGREEEEEEEEASDGDSSIATIDYFRWIPERREDPDAALTPEGSEEGRSALVKEWLEGAAVLGAAANVARAEEAAAEVDGGEAPAEEVDGGEAQATNAAGTEDAAVEIGGEAQAAEEQQPEPDQMAARLLELRSRAIEIQVPAVEEVERSREVPAFRLPNLEMLPPRFRETLRVPGSDPYRAVVDCHGQRHIGTFTENF
ncbi:unnamed protein product [Gongylonema pulchrum]|uniref:Uncharacterized protein n=1 Tax=Gongylonema pulchrum TaxID=637853 RepID=A0A183D5K4_9BILA|nr:unnamed protein product [Gongylonema pulchrum]